MRITAARDAVESGDYVVPAIDQIKPDCAQRLTRLSWSDRCSRATVMSAMRGLRTTLKRRK